MTMPKTAAIMVTYNSARTLDRSLAALRRCRDAGLTRAIIVDNASTDDTAAVLRGHADWATVVLSRVNLGFGRGCNLGFESVKEPYTVFVNPDAELEPPCCQRLLEFLDDRPEAAMVAPVIIPAEGGLQHFGGLPTPSTVLGAASGLRPSPPGRRYASPGEPPVQTDWVCGALFMIRSAEFKGSGGFDPRFFLYFEETDLCRRLVRSGQELWVIPDAVAHHVGGASASESRGARVGGCIAEHYFQSRYYYLRKHFGPAAAAATEAGELALLSARAAARRLRSRDSQDLTARFGWPMFRSPLRPSTP